MPRLKKTKIQTLHSLLHRQLTVILSGLRFSPNERAAYVKCWYNADLYKLRNACKKIMNICDSIHREQADQEYKNINHIMGVKPCGKN